MKIFNWVQRRFHHNVLNDGLSRSVKKTDAIAIDTNTKALLEQVALVDVLDGWQDGILTIGTFGFDPLKSFGDQKDYYSALERDDEQEEEAEDERYSDKNIDDDDDDDKGDFNNSDEEVNPLIFSTYDNSFEDIESNIDHAKHGKQEVIMTVDGVVEGPTTDHEIKFNRAAIQGQSGKLRRRTTLADLFSEDSDMKKKPCPLELDSNSCKKASFRTKHGLSFAKRLIPQVGENSRPIQKLHQMMRRMLKRKIHPELEGKGNKLNELCKVSVIDVLGSKKHEAVESVYLLQSPDAAAATA